VTGSETFGLVVAVELLKTSDDWDVWVLWSTGRVNEMVDWEYLDYVDAESIKVILRCNDVPLRSEQAPGGP
jgi:hypothetical protein